MKHQFLCLQLLIALFVVGLSLHVSAQCDSLAQAVEDTSGYIMAPMLTDSTIDSSAALPLNALVPRYSFDYGGDSVHVKLDFSEFLLNRKKLYLDYWCRDRVVTINPVTNEPTWEWSDSVLRARSRTRVFDVVAGDTIQFFRFVYWADRLLDQITYVRYINPSPLSYSIRLHEASNGNPILLLDTMYFAPTTVSKRPCIFSWFPLTSRVRTIVPSAIMDTTEVYVSVQLFTQPNNPFPIVRSDKLDIGMSPQILSNIQWMAYSDSVQANLDCTGAPDCDVSAYDLSNPPRIQVTLTTPSALTSISIVTIHGIEVWSGALPLASNPYHMNISPGLYIVVGKENGIVQCTRKVYVP